MGKTESEDESFAKVLVPNNVLNNKASSFELELKNNATVRVELFNDKGLKVNSMNIKNLKKGSNTVTLSTSGLPSGVYTAKVFAKGRLITQHDITIQE